MAQEITQALLHSLFSYDPLTGVFRWKVKRSPLKVGDVAGYVHSSGHVYISVQKKMCKAHRLAWLYVYGEWPTGEIDHKDRNGSNNAIGNLRCASSTQNKANTGMRSTNTSGCPGVTLFKRTGKWRAEIAGKHLGYFTEKEKAEQVYIAAHVEKYGQFSVFYKDSQTV